MHQGSLNEYFQQHQAAMLEALAELVQHESPSLTKSLLDRLSRRLRERFEAVGAEVSLLVQAEAGDHLRVRVSPEDPAAASAQPALLLCHFDTVWPAGTLETRPFRLQDNMAWGPGVYDMKGGIVLAEFVLRAIRDLALPLPRPVVILLTSDEEVGSVTSRARIEQEARRAAYVLVLESALPDGALKTARKGVGRFVLEIEGRASHSGGAPEKGISAIQELARQIIYLHGLSDLELGTTVNVGVVQGGTRPNVVAAYAEAEIDARAWTRAEVERITETLLQLEPLTSGTTVRVRGGFTRMPLERGPAVVALFRRVRQIGRSLGLEIEEGSSGGGSDGNFTAALGVPTLDGLGAPGGGAHAEHEHVLVDALPTRAALLTALLLQL